MLKSSFPSLGGLNNTSDCVPGVFSGDNCIPHTHAERMSTIEIGEIKKTEMLPPPSTHAFLLSPYSALTLSFLTLPLPLSVSLCMRVHVCAYCRSLVWTLAFKMLTKNLLLVWRDLPHHVHPPRTYPVYLCLACTHKCSHYCLISRTHSERTHCCLLLYAHGRMRNC